MALSTAHLSPNSILRLAHLICSFFPLLVVFNVYFILNFGNSIPSDCLIDAAVGTHSTVIAHSILDKTITFPPISCTSVSMFASEQTKTYGKHYFSKSSLSHTTTRGRKWPCASWRYIGQWRCSYTDSLIQPPASRHSCFTPVEIVPCIYVIASWVGTWAGPGDLEEVKFSFRSQESNERSSVVQSVTLPLHRLSWRGSHRTDEYRKKLWNDQVCKK